jgi:hypothetical protein
MMGTPCCKLGGHLVVLPLSVYILFCSGLLSMQGDIKKLCNLYSVKSPFGLHFDDD